MKFIRIMEPEEALSYYPTPFARTELHEIDVGELAALLTDVRRVHSYPRSGGFIQPSMETYIERHASFPKPIVLMAIPPFGPPPYALHLLLDGRHRSTAAVRLHAAGRLPATSRLQAMVGRGQRPVTSGATS